MPEYKYRPDITLKAKSHVQARNRLLRLLAGAEIRGDITHFSIPYKPEVVG